MQMFNINSYHLMLYVLMSHSQSDLMMFVCTCVCVGVQSDSLNSDLKSAFRVIK